MRIDTWDSVFVRARRRDVHPWLADLGGWQQWWPGLQARTLGGSPQRTGDTPASSATGDGPASCATGDAPAPSAHTCALSVVLQPPGARQRTQRYTVRLATVRADLGIKLHYRGDLNGEAEFYYLDEPSGCVVHYLVHAQAGPQAPVPRLAADHWAAARSGLNALKDRLEAGREPGAEPDPALLVAQRLAIDKFRASNAAAERGHATATPPGDR
ncbi:hypothetical protein BH20ACT7_BH20ACT7_18910 [soil metagenome]